MHKYPSCAHWVPAWWQPGETACELDPALEGWSPQTHARPWQDFLPRSEEEADLGGLWKTDTVPSPHCGRHHLGGEQPHTSSASQISRLRKGRAVRTVQQPPPQAVGLCDCDCRSRETHSPPSPPAQTSTGTTGLSRSAGPRRPHLLPDPRGPWSQTAGCGGRLSSHGSAGLAGGGGA